MNKYIILVLTVVVILLVTISPKLEPVLITEPLFGKVIFVDAGHGGRDPGTIYGTIYEKDINLEIAKILEQKLTSLGAIVYMTRESDVDLSSKYDKLKKRGDLYRRLLMIDNKDTKTDIYLSIHINWYRNSYWSGAEILYNKVNHNNKILAEFIFDSLKNDLKTKRSVKETTLYMYRNAKTPGVLIECGFLSNANERYLLRQREYQEKLAISITNGVIKYFKNKEG